MSSKSKDEIKSWLINYLSSALKIQPALIEGRKAFDRYGLDSVAMVSMTADLSDWLGTELPPTLPYDHPNIDAMVETLASGSYQGVASA